MAYRITKIKCPDKTYASINHEEDEEDGWPEVESIILWWLEFASEKDMCLVPEFLSVIAKIPVEFAAERLNNLYENELVFKSIDDGIAMFCAEDPDDFDDDPDNDPDGGEPMPVDVDIGSANNEEFYPLDTKKVANDMLKELIKMAGEFDRLGLTKEADKIDAMIRKVAGTIKHPIRGGWGWQGDESWQPNNEHAEFDPSLDTGEYPGEFDEDESGELKAYPWDIEDRESGTPEDRFLAAENRNEESAEFPNRDYERKYDKTAWYGDGIRNMKNKDDAEYYNLMDKIDRERRETSSRSPIKTKRRPAKP